jgi:hypothetical protein
MRFCQAAALALVGWYPMAPPYSPNDFDADAPLSQWTIMVGFDTAAACEERKSFAIEKHKRDLPARGQAQTSDAQRYASMTLLSECVASDDPRLAK